MTFLDNTIPTNRYFMEAHMGYITTNRGDFAFQSVDEAIQIIQTTVLDKDDFWVSGEEAYPSLAVFTNGQYAAVTFFQNDTGDMWLSYNEKNLDEIVFTCEGAEYCPTADAVISRNDAFLCIREFLSAYERPSCIQWQEL